MQAASHPVTQCRSSLSQCCHRLRRRGRVLSSHGCGLLLPTERVRPRKFPQLVRGLAHWDAHAKHAARCKASTSRIRNLAKALDTQCVSRTFAKCLAPVRSCSLEASGTCSPPCPAPVAACGWQRSWRRRRGSVAVSGPLCRRRRGTAEPRSTSARMASPPRLPPPYLGSGARAT